MAIDGVETSCAINLLARLLPDSGAPPADQLAASDRDALLAALHRQCWGDRIVTTLTCQACEKLFDLSFELSAVQRHLVANSSSWHPDGAGNISDESGATIRVPRFIDEAGAATLGPRAGARSLAERCGISPDTMEAAGAGLESAAPIIDLELAARCADCGHAQTAHFDVQSFVLQRLLNERNGLLAEIHLLASTYGWSLQDILSLTRSTRRRLATGIENAHIQWSARR